MASEPELRRVAKRLASGWRSETSRRGAGGGSCFAHASAVGYGLRPSRDCAAVLPKSRNRNPHPPRSAMFLAWQMRRQKSALAKASESEGHRVQARPLRGKGWRANGPNGSSRGGLACLTFSFALASALQSFFSQARRRRRVGRRGLPSRDFGSGEERRRPGLPRAAGPRRASRRCAVGREYGPATPATSCRSPGRRAPQRSRAKAAGRSRPRTHERDGNPRRPTSRDLRAPPSPRYAAHGEAPAPQANEAGTALQHPFAIPADRRRTQKKAAGRDMRDRRPGFTAKPDQAITESASGSESGCESGAAACGTIMASSSGGPPSWIGRRKARIMKPSIPSRPMAAQPAL